MKRLTLTCLAALAFLAYAPAAHAGEWSAEKLERWHSLHTKQHANQWPEQLARIDAREAAKAAR